MIGKGLDCLTPVYLKRDERVLTNFRGFLEETNVCLRVPCGHCLNCKMRRAREWCLRLEMESVYHDDICFVTLTYDNDNLPYNFYDLKGELLYSGRTLKDCEEDLQDSFYHVSPSLCSRHLQLFLKRLRKQLEYEVRFYAVGEYGTKLGRPHYHVMFFGLKKEDYDLVKKCWNFGFVQIKPFFKETCVYIAGYVQKKLYGKLKNQFRLPEFMRCSKGIGLRWLMDNYKHIDPEKPVIHHNGFIYALPRYFRDKLVDIGYLKDSNIYDFFFQQIDEYEELADWLMANNITMSDFFKNRYKIAKEKIRKKNSKRDLTGDI